MTHNPYEPPKANVYAADAAVAAPAVPDAAEILCTPNQLFLAAFIGGPLAAAWIAATNYDAIGQHDEGRRVIGWSILAVAILIGIGTFLPERIPGVVLPLAYGFGIRAAAEHKFGAIVKDHKAAGGLLMYWWRVIGTALLVAAIIFAIALVAVLLLMQFGLMPSE